LEKLAYEISSQSTLIYSAICQRNFSKLSIVPPREERFFALIGANRSDERLDDFYQRLADSDPQQVKKLIFLLVGLDLYFALDRMDEDIKVQEKLIPTVCDAAQNFIEIGSKYLSYFPISAQKSFISAMVRTVSVFVFVKLVGGTL
jgi:hypothetical protein